MVRNTSAKRQLFAGFVSDESGTISVDWAVMAAVVAGLAIAAATNLSDSTMSFENKIEATLKDNLSNVEATGGGTRIVGSSAPSNDDGSDVEFGFAGLNSVTSTISSEVDCGEYATSCGRSAETLSEEFLMTDGSVWLRQTTTYSDDSSESVVWLDDTGREATDIPEIPEDIPVMTF